ncbi:Hypothetical protein A7982_02925 [Minicystis rosea]|nr:Hypothetical protein A7982_02925 [Minicystis rosea]
MLPRLFGPACVGASVVLSALMVPVLASAGENRVISSDQSLGGDIVADTFTVTATGKLHVTRLSASDPMGGWLRVKANTITIAAGGIIEADGAGYAGKEGDNGQSPTGTGGGGKGANQGFPGGGGGFFAKGGDGSSEATAGVCVTYGGASPGGQAFFDMATKTPMLGAAGGAATVMPVTATAGGSGGGGIILQAAVVKIDGTISASGSKPFAIGGVAPGGGSGGTVQIIAAQLEGSGIVAVKGGDGAHGGGSTNPANPIAANNGGGGSGGVILLSLPQGVMAPSSLMLQVTGGSNGCNMTAASGAVFVDAMASSCVDLDGDGFQSSQCGGDDCDDSDPDVHPDASEVCDGRDNDCNAKTDDGDDLCAPGTTCVEGACRAITSDGGVPDAGAADAGATPDHVEFGGGCAVPATGALGEGAAALSMLALGTIALGMSRRSPRRRAR